ncbi:hypothetical protein [Legionella brunensis]|uniref:Coiled-coil protein n=1 Tax=Legionella brunensis TaxID=29422 RepID=A0A0W0SU92_9GAMM|nr:hypothetical protein [Legionella brunensis]KTC86943.1 coiled-coil protein [Legionella brunensis]
MGKKELKALQEEVDKVSVQMQKRVAYYSQATIDVRQKFTTYFFNAKLTDSLIERPDKGQEIFDFDEISESLKACLVDEQTLVSKAEAIKVKSQIMPSLVDALDANILGSQLPFIRHGSGYIFSQENPYTPKGQTYMRQFAHALSIYRVCLGICESYYLITNDVCLNVQTHQEAIFAAENLTVQLTKPEDSTPLIDLWRNGKAIKRTLNDLTANIDTFTPQFEEKIAYQTSRLTQLFEDGAALLQEGCKQFPNTSLLTFIFFDQWRAMLKDLANHFYLGKYSSSFQGILTVNSECSELKRELSEFHAMTTDRLPLLKTELLAKGYKVINECLSCLRMEASRKKISLTEAPERGMFALKNTYYWGMLALLGSKASTPSDNLQFEGKEFTN